MGFAPDYAGPHDPVPTTPARSAGSIRRTTSIDTVRPLGLDGPIAEIDARARDLSTAIDGSAMTLETLRVAVALEHPSQVITALGAEPLEGALQPLVGRRIGGGFRDAAMAASPDHADGGSLRYLLLDDLPGATLVSGYALQHHDTTTGTEAMSAGARSHPDAILGQSDICAGWGADAVMLTTFRETGILMTPLGPVAPRLESKDDPAGWHPMGTLPPHGMRRRRRIDLDAPDADGTSAFETHFRDSHVDGDGIERVVHEYVVRGRLDDRRRVVIEVESEARVLPWFECPRAIGSAQRIVDVPLGDLRQIIRSEFKGLSTCTHLNDTLRSLAAIEPMLARRPRSDGPTTTSRP